MDKPTAEDLYAQLIEINQHEFEAGYFNAAYHALMSALYCAERIPSNEPLVQVGKIAIEQIRWIDEHRPDYEHSTQSAAKRMQTDSIFSRLSTQAEMALKLRSVKGGLHSNR